MRLSAVCCLLFLFPAFAFSQSTNCATATSITLVNGQACVNGTTVGAVSDNVLWSTCNTAPVNEVWYTFVTSGSNNTFTITPNTLTNTEFILLTGGCYPTGTLQTCNSVTASNINSVVWGLPQGIQVWVGIASNQGTQGTFQFCISSTPPAPSPGFTCATAIPLCNMNTFTLNPMSLNSSGQTPACFGNPTQRDIWYKFTITQAGSLRWTATPVNPADEFDWALWDVTGGCPGTLAVCNYNYAAGSSQGFGMQPTATVCPTSAFGGPTQEYCPPLNVTCGRTYAIQISNYSNTSTGFTFAWTGATCLISSNAAFTTNPSFACAASMTVNINNTSTGTCPGETWTFGDGSPTYTGTAPPPHTYTTPGTYAITATIGGICPSTVVHYVQLYGPLAVTTTSTPINCFGNCNSSAAINTVSGGDGIYTYSWAPGGATTTSITGLCAGTYTVTVFNAACNSSVSSTVTITQPAALTATTTQVNVLCNAACNGSATVTAGGGVGPYTYTWSTTPSQSTVTASGLCAGTYTVTVKDANNCTRTATVTITQPPAVTATTTQVNVLCNGACNGSATVTAGGGVAPYTYTWSTTPSQSTMTATGLCAGVYTVIVKDANNCTRTATVTITQPPVLTATTAQVNVLCNGACTGTSTVTALGGTSPYTYSWSTTPSQSAATATGLCAGTYTVTVTDANSCTRTATVTITQPAALTATATSTQSTCNAANGSATATAGGGTGPYTYSWSTTPAQTMATATGLSAGNYTVTVTDANGCTRTATATVTSAGGGTASIASSTNVLCNGGNNGSATVTMTGGTAPFTYSWNTTPVQTTATATGLSAGTYTVTVTDANGCVATSTVTITQPTALTATISASANVLCNGGNNGSATVTVSGGTSPYTYTWSTTPSQSTATATGLTAGSYTVTIKDANNCTRTATVTITQPTPITLSVAGFNASCNGSCNGQAVCIPSGGTPNYTFSWAPSGGTNPSATGLCAGTYTVYVTDQNGCTRSGTATVSQPPVLTATATSTQSTCSAANGTATVTAGGGTSPYTYSWSTTPAQTAATATGLSAGTYTVTVTDANGCTRTATVTVTTASGGTASIASSANVLCNGGNNGSAMVTMTGGTAPYTYSWSTTPVQTTTTASGLTAGSYTVTVTDANGCVATATITITQPPALAATISASTNVLCNGGNNGSATATAGGGTSPYTYSWSTTPSQSTAAATGLNAGSYTVIVTDANGCTRTATVTITQPAVLSVTASATPPVICVGQTSTLAATANGGTPGYTYSWVTGNMTASSVTVSPTATTTYTVTVTDNNGCTRQATALLTVNPLPVVTFTSAPSPAVGCAPLCVNFTNTTPSSASCSWNFTVGTASTCNATQCFNQAGSYNVTLTVVNTNGCVNSLTMPAYVTVYPNPVADFSISPQPTTVLNSTISFTDLSNGSPNQWSWNFGDPLNSTSNLQNPTFTYTDSGTYIVQLTVTTQYGCRASIQKTLRIEPEFLLYVPNAFTPNGDGNNETFYPKGTGLDQNKYKMWIFDRWGNMIWYTETWGKQWDGRANGGTNIAQEDVYVWKIEVYDYLGKKHDYIGRVSLIK